MGPGITYGLLTPDSLTEFPDQTLGAERTVKPVPLSTSRPRPLLLLSQQGERWQQHSRPHLPSSAGVSDGCPGPSAAKSFLGKQSCFLPSEPGTFRKSLRSSEGRGCSRGLETSRRQIMAATALPPGCHFGEQINKCSPFFSDPRANPARSHRLRRSPGSPGRLDNSGWLDAA